MQDTIMRLCASTALMGALALPATAQQIINLEEVTFSANLSDTLLRQSGTAVSILTREDLDRLGAAQLADALRFAPGVSVRRTGSLGGPTDVAIRGASGAYVAVYIDGVLVTDPTQLQTRFDFGSLSTRDIDRIEILRGAQSALYGGSAIGGVISITTKRPETDGTRQTVFVEGGSYGTAELNYNLLHRVGKLELGVSLGRFHTDGFSSIQPIGAGVKFAPDAFDRSSGSAFARYQVSDQLALGISVAREDSVSEYDDRFALADADNIARRRDERVQVSAQYRDGAVSHDVSLGLSRIERRFEEAFRNDLFKGTRHSLRYVGSFEASPDLTLSFGAEISREQFHSASGTPVVFKDESLTKKGVFAEAAWQPTDAFNLTTSLRLDRDANLGNIPSARLAASYQVSPELRLRGVVSNGYRAPTMEERFADYDFRDVFPYYFAGNPNLRRERALSAELGVDWQATSDFSLSATAFYTLLKDAIRGCGAFEVKAVCDIPLPVGVTASYENIDRVRRSGVELSADWLVSDKDSLKMNYTGLDARITAGPAAGARMATAPRHTVSVLWERQITDRLTATSSLLVKAGRLESDGGPKMPSYGLVNFNLDYELTQNASLSLRVENMFDKKYQEVASFGTSGRAFYLGVASRF